MCVGVWVWVGGWVGVYVRSSAFNPSVAAQAHTTHTSSSFTQYINNNTFYPLHTHTHTYTHTYNNSNSRCNTCAASTIPIIQYIYICIHTQGLKA